MERNPVVVQGSDCDYDPFAQARRRRPAARALDALTKRGVAYTLVPAPGWQRRRLSGAGSASTLVDAEDPAALEPALAQAGYRLEKTRPPLSRRDPGRARDHRHRLPLGHDLRAGRGLARRDVPGRGSATPRCRCPIISAPAISAASCPSSASISSPGPAIPSPASGTRSAVVAMALVVTLFWLPETAGKRLAEPTASRHAGAGLPR